MTKMPIRGITLHVQVKGHGYPLVLMHGGPGADLYTLMAYRTLAKFHTLVFYDHRCNGRSTGADVSTMTWENLTADADALRQALGFEKWAVLGHSFGGYVALEYALRYPQKLSHLILVDTGGTHWWASEHSSQELAKRGFEKETIDLAHRFLNGDYEPDKMFSNLMKLGNAYNPYTDLSDMPEMIWFGVKTKLQPSAHIYCATHLLKGWNVMDKLNEINVPTLVMAGRDDFIYPPEHQEQIAALIPNASLVIIDQAGHNVHDEQKSIALKTVREFLASTEPSH